MKPEFNTPQDLEKFTTHKGLRAVKKHKYHDRYIYIAETDLEMDKKWEYPNGYYQVAWFVSHPNSDEKFDGGSWLEFDYMHDKHQNWTQETKKMARRNAAYKQAVKWLESNFETGRYAK